MRGGVGKDAPPTDPNWTQRVAALRANLDPLLINDRGSDVLVWIGTKEISGADVSAASAPLVAALARLGADNMADPPRIIRLTFSVDLPTAAKRERGATARLAAPMLGLDPLPRVLRSAPLSVTALCATPSADLLWLAFQELPNVPGGAFDDSDDWLHMAMAVKGAAVAGGSEAKGREALCRGRRVGEVTKRTREVSGIASSIPPGGLRHTDADT